MSIAQVHIVLIMCNSHCAITSTVLYCIEYSTGGVLRREHPPRDAGHGDPPQPHRPVHHHPALPRTRVHPALLSGHHRISSWHICSEFKNLRRILQQYYQQIKFAGVFGVVPLNRYNLTI
jgi:hypothetical protein